MSPVARRGRLLEGNGASSRPCSSKQRLQARERAAEQISRSSPAEIATAPADVSSWQDVEGLAATARDRFGAAHLVCNNAGVTRLGLAWDLTVEDWDWVFGINFRGVVHGVKAFVPDMLATGEPGHIVNTASIAGLLPFKALAAYTASKYAVVGLSECLLHDLRAAEAPIGVSVLCPGPTDTEFRTHSEQLYGGSGETYVDPAAGGVLKVTPGRVAHQVVAAIEADRFWIVTHPAYEELIEARCRGILETDEVVAGAYL